MRLALLTVLTALFYTSVAAQHDHRKFRAYLQPLKSFTSSSPRSTTHQARSVIWAEDFANGLNGNNGAWTVNGPNPLWEYTESIAPGCYSLEADDAVDFTSKSNGFMLYHSDLANCIDAEPNPPISNDEKFTGTLLSPPIDLSDETAVAVRFEHHFSHCCDYDIELLFSVSTDGGNSWTDYNVSNQTPPGIINSNPFHQVNITPLAAGESDVRLKFVWNADTTASHHFWAIDDIAVFEPAEFDLTIDNVTYGDFNPDTSQTFRDLEYSMYPISEVRALILQSAITNNGSQNQQNVHLRVQISNGLGYSDTLYSDSVDLAPGASAEFQIPYTPPSELPFSDMDEYELIYTSLSDSEDDYPEDNADSTFFRINSKGKYARDRLAMDGEYSSIPEGYEVGNVFHFTQSATLRCVGVALSSNTTPGIIFTIIVRSRDNFEYITESYVLTAPWLLNEPGENHIEWAYLTDNVELEPGDELYIGINHFGGDDALSTATSGISPVGTTFFSPSFNDTTWYMSSQTPMIQVGLDIFHCIFKIPGSIQKIDRVSAFQLFPNPTIGFTTVEFTLLETTDVSISLYDIRGVRLFDEALGIQPEGAHRFQFDWSSLASGHYTISLTAGDQKFSEKLVIE